jgi:hypothetical protein
MQAYLTSYQRLARTLVAASLGLVVTGTLSFVAGSRAYYAQDSVLATYLTFVVPTFLLFLYSMSRVRNGEFLRAVLVSIVGGLLMIVAAISAAIFSAYASPCFEQAALQ